MVIKKDSLGEIEVPDDVLYGPETQRAVGNFNSISGTKVDKEIVLMIIRLKKACALANEDYGMLAKNKAEAIVEACNQILDGKIDYDKNFPLDAYQTGSGTSLNMNVNEVLANLAAKNSGLEIHPNDDVNASQSSNDIIPSAVMMANLAVAEQNLIPVVMNLIQELYDKSTEFEDVIKAARTHLQDAVPITLGQEFSAYAGSFEACIPRISANAVAMSAIPIGGTAVGTGVNTKRGFRKLVLSHIFATNPQIFVSKPDNKFTAQSSRYEFVAFSSALKMLATQLIKMCNDLMIMSSGPTNGLNEINIPAVQPGSSIMPGKVNPVILESVIQVCSRVIGNDASITFSASNAFFELNTNTLFIGEVMLNSMKIMSNAMNILTEKTIKGITANVEVMERYANSTVALSTVLTKVVGYDKAAEIAKLAVAEQSTVKDAAIKLGILEHISEEELNDLLDPRSMLYPIRRNSKIVVNV